MSCHDICVVRFSFDIDTTAIVRYPSYTSLADGHLCAKNVRET